MAESRAARMGIVLDLAQKEEDKAAQTLEKCRVQLLDEQAQLQQLVDYRAQYLQDYTARDGALTPAQLINYSTFIQRIDSLTAEQTRKCERAEQIVMQAQQIWQRLYQKRKSIADLIIRYQQEELALADKRLQKELDDLTTQRFSRQKES